MTATLRRREVSYGLSMPRYPSLMGVTVVILGRPARVFWDLEFCSIAGKDYFQGIMNSIRARVKADTGLECFEIYAVRVTRP